jgi:RNA polymerase sigma-70 factor (ECF subfamily)
VNCAVIDAATPLGVAAAEAVARRSYGKLVAFLAARTRDVAAAEDALATAFEAALRDWPAHGVPSNPEAWLMTAAKRQLIDAARRRKTHDEAAPDVLLFADLVTDDSERRAIPDDRLLLMFACAHPAIEPNVRAPLMLQTILGFDAATIASAFLVAPATMGQRLVRAKAKIKQAGVPFRLPDHDDLAERLDAVLEAIYATYTEGWSDPAGTEARRRNLAEEGIWLGELVTTLLPDEPEALDARLVDYQPYWAARAGLLARSGDAKAADEAYRRAIGLEADPAVRCFLQQRREALRGR